jgi:hypothetical protein
MYNVVMNAKKLGLDLSLFATWPNLGVTWPRFKPRCHGAYVVLA